MKVSNDLIIKSSHPTYSHRRCTITFCYFFENFVFVITKVEWRIRDRKNSKIAEPSSKNHHLAGSTSSRRQKTCRCDCRAGIDEMWPTNGTERCWDLPFPQTPKGKRQFLGVVSVSSCWSSREITVCETRDPYLLIVRLTCQLDTVRSGCLSTRRYQQRPLIHKTISTRFVNVFT